MPSGMTIDNYSISSYMTLSVANGATLNSAIVKGTLLTSGSVAAGSVTSTGSILIASGMVNSITADCNAYISVADTGSLAVYAMPFARIEGPSTRIAYLQPENDIYYGNS